MSHYLSSTAIAARDSRLAERIRIEEVLDGWDSDADIDDIMSSSDIDIAFDEDHPELGALGAMDWDAACAWIEAMRG